MCKLLLFIFITHVLRDLFSGPYFVSHFFNNVFHDDPIGRQNIHQQLYLHIKRNSWKETTKTMSSKIFSTNQLYLWHILSLLNVHLICLNYFCLTIKKQLTIYILHWKGEYLFNCRELDSQIIKILYVIQPQSKRRKLCLIKKTIGVFTKL